MDQASLMLILSSGGVLQTLFLSVYIFSSRKILIGERLLLGFLLLTITIRLIKSIGWYFFDIEHPLFLNIGFAAHGFIGPILILYFASKARILKRNWIRATILCPAILLLLASPFLRLNTFWYIGGYKWLLYFTLVYLIGCGFLLWKIYSQKKIYFPWYRNLFLGVAIFCIAYFTNYVFGLNPYIVGPVMYSIVIYAISFILFTHHEIFTPVGDKKKYKNINLTDDQVSIHKEKIQGVMLDQKPYLDSDFSLSTLSNLTSIPKHLLSRYFSENMNQSFTDYTNGFRIEKAKELLVSPVHQNHKIAFIAYECGFNSISSFNTAFKKYVDSSPSEYKKISLTEGH